MNISNSARPDVTKRRPNWWLRLTSSGWDRPAITLQERENLRRSTLASWVLLVILIADLIVSAAAIGDLHSIIAILAAGVGAIIAAVCNRSGHITAAGVVLTAVLVGAILFVITPEGETTPAGALDFDALPIYDLLTVPVIISISIVSLQSGFWVAGCNIFLMILDFALQPHTPYLENLMLHSYGGDFVGTAALLARPIALQVVIASMAYLWVRGVQRASVRADLAEQELELQRRYGELEEKNLRDAQFFAEQFTTAVLALSQGRLVEIVLPQEHPFAKIAPFLNSQLRVFDRLKRSRKQEDILLAAAVNHLLTILTQMASSRGDSLTWYHVLHPQRFTTRVPIVDEIARRVYEQLDFAYSHLQGRKSDLFRRPSTMRLKWLHDQEQALYTSI